MSYTNIQGNTVQNGGASTTTMTVTLPVPATVGNTLIITFGATGLLATDTVTFTDNNSNMYTPAFTTPIVNSAGALGITAAYFVGLLNRPQTVTVTISHARTFLFMIVDEWSPTGPLDVLAGALVQHNPGTGANAVTSGPITTITNGDLIYGFGITAFATGFSAVGTGFTLAPQGVSSYFATEYLTQPTAGTISAPWTDAAATDQTIAYILAFQPYVAPPPPLPPPPPPIIPPTPEALLATVVASLTGGSLDIVNRVKRLIPYRWFSWVAPYRDAILGGLADLAAWSYTLIQYARSQSRLASAYGIWLDIFAYDYLGRFLIRNGAADDTFRAIIRATILQERVTRKGMINAIAMLTGNVPSIFEPWNTQDTGAYSGSRASGAPQYGSFGYNVGVGGYGNMILNNQSFIQIIRGSGAGVPGIAGYGNNIAGYGVGLTEYVGITSETWGITDPMIFDMVNKTKPTGTTVWVAFVTPTQVLTSESGIILTDESGTTKLTGQIST
jgi:hypothetical protein